MDIDHMISLVFDLEANGLLDDVTTIHCIGVLNSLTGQEFLFGPDQIQDGLRLLDTADELLAHSGVGYDLPVLKKLYGWEPRPTTKSIDTMLWSMRMFPDILGKGKKKNNDDDDDAEEIILGHSLESWGKRLGCHKGAYTGGWETYSEEMGAYCQQDCRVTEALRRHLVSLNKPAPTADDIERQFAALVQRQEARGFAFDVPAAEALLSRLEGELESLREAVSQQIPADIEVMKTPAYWTATWPVEDLTTQFPTKCAADLYRKLHKIKPKECSLEPGPMAEKRHPFNMGSRTQIMKYLFTKYGWTSPSLTEGGEKMLGTATAEKLAEAYGSLSEEILRGCEFPEGQQFADYLLLSKAKSFLLGAKANTGWLTLVKKGRIHHRMLTLGCVTGRCSHSKPNLGQVPRVITGKDKHPVQGIKGRFGFECRSLFHADRVQVGVDMQAIESRNLGHYLQPYDGGRYIKEVLNGDIHQRNVEYISKYAGYSISRGDSKSGATYPWFYGAANLKLGTLITVYSKEAMEEYVDRRNYFRRSPNKIGVKVWSKVLEKRRYATPEEAAFFGVGAKVRNAYEQGIDGLPLLLAALEEAAKRGYLTMPDGRQLPIRSKHAALNTLLQGSAAVLMKKWIVLTEEYNRRDQVDWHPLAIVHDECQSDVREDHVVRHSTNCIQAIKDAGVYFHWRCPLDGEAKVGKNWAECH